MDGIRGEPMAGEAIHKTYKVRVSAIFRYTKTFDVEGYDGINAEEIAIRDMQELPEDDVLSAGGWDFYAEEAEINRDNS